MPSYTPLQPGQTPALGTSGQAVAEMQAQLNTQNAGKQGWSPLVVDGRYGPLTQAGANFKPENQLIVTGSKPSKEFSKNSQDVNQMIEKKGSYLNPQTPNTTGNPNGNPDGNAQIGKDQKEVFDAVANYSDPYTQMLDKISATSDKATQNLIATIKATKAGREANINNEYDRLKQGLFSLGLSTDKLTYTPDLVYGGIMQAENARATKLQELDRDEATALLEAQQASEDKDFKVLREKMAYIKDIKKTRTDILKENYETMSYESKIGEIQANQIYDNLQKLPEDKKLPFLQEIATRFDIPLAALTSQVSEITRARAKSAKSGSSSASVTKDKNAAIKNINSILNDKSKDDSGYSVRGEDSYVDPGVYLDLYNQWLAADFTDEEFFNKFDPKVYINPSSYGQLPVAFRPKKAGRSS